MYTQAQGTLVPGQTIEVGKYTVQVEKYLAQGGFAHIYLVRTATPVFNTTRHVLKRIAVPNESMLTEVKKEVDVMRILRGHPNIVYLIDAAWHRSADSLYEVFILMEFCPGGGLIDMMNRRLRERLTEPEILQIFVDVCEGVAAMHNLKPPLLHRDLKVENILQASATSYKLCDFGSTVPVSRPPTTTQEIRALEADLNRHTTLQYRAPEMVDPYLRRAVDEKSDVWALGVLLYKLCYYTTPFEEHGVLAILNVQYRIPPYPVYSSQLNTLIGSMLREHGALRPSAFEVLDQVHKMRGSKSSFVYNIPPRMPLSPTQPVRPVLAPSADIATSKTGSGSGIKARDTAIETVAPVRRGRPSAPATKETFPDSTLSLSSDRPVDPWKLVKIGGAKAHKSGMASIASSDGRGLSPNLGEAWRIDRTQGFKYQSPSPVPNAFADSFKPTASPSPGYFTQNITQDPIQPINQTIKTPTSSVSTPSVSVLSRGDAFDSLKVFPSKVVPPTLGEAQKSANLSRLSPNKAADTTLRSGATSLSQTPESTSSTLPVSVTSVSSVSHVNLRQQPSDWSIPAEKRFPSLEELDGENLLPNTFGLPSSTKPPYESAYLPPTKSTGESPRIPPSKISFTGTRRIPESTLNLAVPHQDGVRSQHVTGTAMRESKERIGKVTPVLIQSAKRDLEDMKRNVNELAVPRASGANLRRSPALPSRRSPSSLAANEPPSSPSSGKIHEKASSSLVGTASKDWLTGDDSDNPILRASPEKRASILHSPIASQATLETLPSNPSFDLPDRRPSPLLLSSTLPSQSGLTDNWSPIASSPNKLESSSDSDDGPEDAGRLIPSKAKPTSHRAKGRQSSVHELVDLWGGSVHDKGVPSTTIEPEKKRRSLLLDLSSTSQANGSKPPKLPPRQEVKLEIGVKATELPGPSGNERPAPSSRPPSHRKEDPATSLRDNRNTRASKARPQSMFLQPVQKSISEGLRSPPGSALPASGDGKQFRPSPRRSSISDLVSRYEANGAIKPKAPVKPARLKAPSAIGATSSSDSALSTVVASPTAASLKFPRISPTTSPVRTRFGKGLPTASLALAVPAGTVYSRHRRETTSGSRLDDASHSSSSKLSQTASSGDESPLPLRRTPAKSSSPTRPVRVDSSVKITSQPSIFTSAHSRSQSQARSGLKISPQPQILLPRQPSPVEEKEGIHSPAPEKPYQGVSKLIDQWQRKTAEAEGHNPLPVNRRGRGGFRKEAGKVG